MTDAISHTKISITGRVEVRKNGEVIYSGKNLVVNNGLILIAKLLGATGTKPGWMAVGDDSTEALGTQVDLQGTEIARVVATPARVSNTVSYTSDFTGENVGTVTVGEFGIFNDATAGDLFARFVCTEFLWAVSDTLEVTWSIDIGELA